MVQSEIASLSSAKALMAEEHESDRNATSKEMADLSATLTTTREELTRTLSQVAMLDDEISTLRSRVSEMEASLANATSEIGSLQDVKSRMEVEHANLTAEHGDMMRSKCSEIDELSTDVTKLRRELDESRGEVAAQSAQVSTLKEMLSTSELATANAREEISDLTTTKMNLEVVISDQTMEIE